MTSRQLTSALLLVGVLLAWHGLHLLAGGTAISSPWATAQKAWALLFDGDFWESAGETARAFAVAFVLGTAGGIALGIALGVSRLASDVAEPILINLYSIPKVTLYPLVLLCFGLGISARIAFGVMHGMIPVTIFTMNAIRSLKPVYMRSARAMRLGAMQSGAFIVFPAVLPEILSGVRLGLSLTLLGVLIGEMFASRRGLGFVLTSAMNIGDVDTIMAVALLLSAAALLANSILYHAQLRALRGARAVAN
jgi:NitT/TauT family transport system permease protein